MAEEQQQPNEITINELVKLMFHQQQVQQQQQADFHNIILQQQQQQQIQQQQQQDFLRHFMNGSQSPSNWVLQQVELQMMLKLLIRSQDQYVNLNMIRIMILFLTNGIAGMKICLLMMQLSFLMMLKYDY